MKTKILSLVFALLQIAVRAQVNYGISNSVAYVAPSSVSGNIVIASTYNGYPVVAIGDYAFRFCYGLTNVMIPNSVTSIGAYAFSSCVLLTNITVPNGVTNIGNFAFSECASLANVGIPNLVTNISTGLFDACDSLTGEVIGTNITSIGDYAFAYCRRLTNIDIPNSVSNISELTFFGSTNLTKITFFGNAPTLTGSGEPFPGSVYYYYGTMGWATTYNGAPTVMLGAPPPQIVIGSANVLSGTMGFTVIGVTNQAIVVESATDLINWQPAWTNVLSGASTNFTDSQWTNYSSRFYRAR